MRQYDTIMSRLYLHITTTLLIRPGNTLNKIMQVNTCMIENTGVNKNTPGVKIEVSIETRGHYVLSPPTILIVKLK